jgi:hypothetical protein
VLSHCLKSFTYHLFYHNEPLTNALEIDAILNAFSIS